MTGVENLRGFESKIEGEFVIEQNQPKISRNNNLTFWQILKSKNHEIPTWREKRRSRTVAGTRRRFRRDHPGICPKRRSDQRRMGSAGCFALGKIELTYCQNLYMVFNEDYSGGNINEYSWNLQICLCKHYLGEDPTEGLAKSAQNLVASMISLPFQINTNFEVGP